MELLSSDDIQRNYDDKVGLYNELQDYDFAQFRSER